MVYPDILANSGGVIGSFYEWQMNLNNAFITRESFNHQLRSDMIKNLDLVDKKAIDLKCTPRKAAYVIAIERLIKARKARGY